MLLKKKLCIGALLCGVLLFMIASQVIQRRRALFKTDRAFHSTARNTVKSRTQPKIVTEPSQHHSCSCRPCTEDLGISDWFDKHYDSKQQPYLTEENEIDPLSLKWWMALQRSVNGTIKEVLKKMFKVISPPNLKANQQPGECKKCAVVGNSGNLLQFKYGAIIDSHSIVIRMNRATTSGFEKYVGNKTTHHFMYPESAVDLAPGVHLVLLPFKLRDLEWVTSALSTGEITQTYMTVKKLVRADKDKVIVVNPSFFKYTHDFWTEHHGRYPSTGMMAVIFALHICDEVSVFGFGANSEGNWHHYWEDNKFAGAFRKTGVHDADYERKVILKLEELRKIKLYPKTKQKTSDNFK